MANHRAALRTEGEIVARPLVLDQRFRNAIRIGHRALAALPTARRLTCKAADRYRSSSAGETERYAGNVVKALLIRIIRKQGSTIHFKPQEVTNGVCVLGSIQAMNRHATRVGIGRARFVERSLQLSASAL